MPASTSFPPTAPEPSLQENSNPTAPIAPPRITAKFASAAGPTVVFTPSEQRPAPRPSFWQQPWVQNVLPFATSVALHVGLIIIGYATYKTVQRVVEVVQEQIIIPESTMADNGPPGGVAHPGLGEDPTRDAAQDLKDVTDSQNWATKSSDNLNQAAMGGEADVSAMIAVGANTAAGQGSGPNGMGDSSGQLAPFGVPGGGSSAGPKSSFLGVGGNARRIVYLVDASGSMLSVFGDLKLKLKESIDALKPIQSFNVIFFSGDKTDAFQRGALVVAGPENKRKVYDFIDNIVTHGGTNPMEAIDIAMSQKPELLYVLTDGFDQISNFDDVISAFRRGNPEKKTHINCLFLQSDDDPKLVEVLKQIARDNGGLMKIISKSGF